jgi:hypothetical protein
MKSTGARKDPINELAVHSWINWIDWIDGIHHDFTRLMNWWRIDIPCHWLSCINWFTAVAPRSYLTPKRTVQPLWVVIWETPVNNLIELNPSKEAPTAISSGIWSASKNLGLSISISWGQRANVLPHGDKLHPRCLDYAWYPWPITVFSLASVETTWSCILTAWVISLLLQRLGIGYLVKKEPK